MNAHQMSYLHAMGIQPWLLKNRPENSISSCSSCSQIPTGMLLSIDNASSHLMVICEINNNSSARKLLFSMLQAIGFFNENLQEENAFCLACLEKQINTAKPILLLVLNPVIGSQLNHHFNNIPVITTFSLTHLLQHPLDKSKTFLDLQLANKILAK